MVRMDLPLLTGTKVCKSASTSTSLARMDLVAPKGCKMTFAKSQDAQARSRLFALPPELQLIIYTFAFGHDTPPQEISLAHLPQCSPSKSLLQTCQLVHNEARDLYNQAARAFWTTNTSTITAADSATAAIQGLQDVELGHIQHIRIYSAMRLSGEEKPVLELTPGTPSCWDVDVIPSRDQAFSTSMA